ncbi:MAG: DUF4124 domain-containing protein [Gammaproteobacteria bacterium]
MLRRLLSLLLCMTPICGWAEVFTWVDEDGMTHYSDRPPAQGNANVVDLGSQPLSTLGASGLRPAEQEMLRQIEERAKAEAAARAAAASAPPPPAPIIVEQAPNQETSTLFIPSWNYYPWLYPGHPHKPHYGLDFHLNFGNGYLHYGHDWPPNQVGPWTPPRPPPPRPNSSPPFPPPPTNIGITPRSAFAPRTGF